MKPEDKDLPLGSNDNNQPATEDQDVQSSTPIENAVTISVKNIRKLFNSIASVQDFIEKKQRTLEEGTWDDLFTTSFLILTAAQAETQDLETFAQTFNGTHDSQIFSEENLRNYYKNQLEKLQNIVKDGLNSLIDVIQSEEVINQLMSEFLKEQIKDLDTSYHSLYQDELSETESLDTSSRSIQFDSDFEQNKSDFNEETATEAVEKLEKLLKAKEKYITNTEKQVQGGKEAQAAKKLAGTFQSSYLTPLQDLKSKIGKESLESIKKQLATIRENLDKDEDKENYEKQIPAYKEWFDALFSEIETRAMLHETKAQLQEATKKQALDQQTEAVKKIAKEIRGNIRQDIAPTLEQLQHLADIQRSNQDNDAVLDSISNLLGNHVVPYFSNKIKNQVFEPIKNNANNLKALQEFKKDNAKIEIENILKPLKDSEYYKEQIAKEVAEQLEKEKIVEKVTNASFKDLAGTLASHAEKLKNNYIEQIELTEQSVKQKVKNKYQQRFKQEQAELEQFRDKLQQESEQQKQLEEESKRLKAQKDLNTFREKLNEVGNALKQYEQQMGNTPDLSKEENFNDAEEFYKKIVGSKDSQNEINNLLKEAEIALKKFEAEISATSNEDQLDFESKRNQVETIFGRYSQFSTDYQDLLKTKSQKLEQQLQNIEAELQRVQKEFSDKKQLLEQQFSEEKTQLSKEIEQLKQLQGNQSELQKKLHQVLMEKASLEKQIAENNQTISQQQTELSNLQSKLTSEEKANSNLQTQIAQLEDINKKLEQENKQLEGNLSSNLDLIEQLKKQIQMNLDSYNSQLQDLQKQLDETNEANEEKYKNDLNDLEVRLRQEHDEKLKTEINQLKLNHANELEQERKQYQEVLRTNQNTINNLQKDLKQKSEDYDQIKNNLNELNRTQAELTQNFQKIKEGLQQLSVDLQKEQQLNQQLLTEKTDLETKNQRLNQENLNKENKIQQLNQEIEDLRKLRREEDSTEIEKLQAEIAQLQVGKQQAESEIEQNKTKIALLEHNIEQLKELKDQANYLDTLQGKDSKIQELEKQIKELQAGQEYLHKEKQIDIYAIKISTLENDLNEFNTTHTLDALYSDYTRSKQSSGAWKQQKISDVQSMLKRIQDLEQEVNDFQTNSLNLESQQKRVVEDLLVRVTTARTTTIKNNIPELCEKVISDAELLKKVQQDQSQIQNYINAAENDPDTLLDKLSTSEQTKSKKGGWVASQIGIITDYLKKDKTDDTRSNFEKSLRRIAKHISYLEQEVKPSIKSAPAKAVLERYLSELRTNLTTMYALKDKLAYQDYLFGEGFSNQLEEENKEEIKTKTKAEDKQNNNLDFTIGGMSVDDDDLSPELREQQFEVEEMPTPEIPVVFDVPQVGTGLEEDLFLDVLRTSSVYKEELERLGNELGDLFKALERLKIDVITLDEQVANEVSNLDNNVQVSDFRKRSKDYAEQLDSYSKKREEILADIAKIEEELKSDLGTKTQKLQLIQAEKDIKDILARIGDNLNKYIKDSNNTIASIKEDNLDELDKFIKKTFEFNQSVVEAGYPKSFNIIQDKAQDYAQQAQKDYDELNEQYLSLVDTVNDSYPDLFEQEEGRHKLLIEDITPRVNNLERRVENSTNIDAQFKDAVTEIKNKLNELEQKIESTVVPDFSEKILELEQLNNSFDTKWKTVEQTLNGLESKINELTVKIRQHEEQKLELQKECDELNKKYPEPRSENVSKRLEQSAENLSKSEESLNKAIKQKDEVLKACNEVRILKKRKEGENIKNKIVRLKDYIQNGSQNYGVKAEKNLELIEQLKQKLERLEKLKPSATAEADAAFDSIFKIHETAEDIRKRLGKDPTKVENRFLNGQLRTAISDAYGILGSDNPALKPKTPLQFAISFNTEYKNLTETFKGQNLTDLTGNGVKLYSSAGYEYTLKYDRTEKKATAITTPEQMPRLKKADGEFESPEEHRTRVWQHAISMCMQVAPAVGSKLTIRFWGDPNIKVVAAVFLNELKKKAMEVAHPNESPLSKLNIKIDDMDHDRNLTLEQALTKYKDIETKVKEFMQDVGVDFNTLQEQKWFKVLEERCQRYSEPPEPTPLRAPR